VKKGAPTESEWAIQKPWLGQGQIEIFALRSPLKAQAKFLASAGKTRPVCNIEVGLY